MLMFPPIVLAIPINNPFPVTFILSLVVMVSFATELAIAKRKIHPRKWLYVLISAFVALGVLLSGLSAYYSLYGPSAADTLIRLHPGPGPLVRNGYFDFYRTVWGINVVIAVFALLVVPASLVVLYRQKD